MALQHQIMFQQFLAEAKKEVNKNLSLKIFPRTRLENYEVIRILGRGGYGQVVAAQNILSGKTIALKVINKKKLVKDTIMKHLIWEIRILNAIKFDFLISLECYFTNNCYVFLGLPYISGGHFFSLLKKVKKFSEDAAMFFAGQIVLSLEYLHCMGIVYRDLKPENLLLDLQGYIKIVDYGFSKYIGNKFTYTFCGTPEYLAPEILLSKGYTMSPDWWTFGILLYEMCDGSPPFTSKNEYKLYEKILGAKIVWPGHFSSDLKSLIQGLLKVNKSERLGCLKNTVEDIKFHKWFSDLDWDALWNKKIIPPVKYDPLKVVSDRDLFNYGDFSFIKNQNCFLSQSIGNIDIAI